MPKICIIDELFTFTPKKQYIMIIGNPDITIVNKYLMYFISILGDIIDNKSDGNIGQIIPKKRSLYLCFSKDFIKFFLF
jgi:hypothetical protein